MYVLLNEVAFFISSKLFMRQISFQRTLLYTKFPDSFAYYSTVRVKVLDIPTNYDKFGFKFITCVSALCL